MIRTELGANAVVIQLPMGPEDKFTGIIDLVQMKAIICDDETLGAKYEIVEIPEELRDERRECREQLVEAIAETTTSCSRSTSRARRSSIAELKAALREATIARRSSR